MTKDRRQDWQRALAGLISAALGRDATGNGPAATGNGPALADHSALLATNEAFLETLAAGATAAPPALRHEAAVGQGPAARLATFYLRALQVIEEEVSRRLDDPGFVARVASLAAALEGQRTGNRELAEHSWSVFFPEGTGIRSNEDSAVEALRARRTIRVTAANPNPIKDPAREILFTSNVLLTVPLGDAHRARVS
jgi:hypothetical protein